MKRLFMLAVALIMALSAVALVGCGEPKEDPNFDFTLLNDGTYSVSVKDTAKESETLEIPSTYDDIAVTTIGRKGFSGMKKLKSITIPDSVITVGVEAFKGCTALSEISLNKVNKLNKSAFEKCTALTKASLGAVTAIPERCFADCSLLSDISLVGVEQIGNYAFQNCESITSVAFPTEKPLTIGDYAYSRAGITELKIPANAKLGKYTFDHLSWDESAGDAGESRCTAVYFYATEPTTDTLGVNAIGYTWDRADFKVYVPTGTLSRYTELCEQIKASGDDAWVRCITSVGKMAEFDPTEKPY